MQTVQTPERSHAFGPHAKPVRRRAPRKPELIGGRLPGYRYDLESFGAIYYEHSCIGELGNFIWMRRVLWPDTWNISVHFAGAFHHTRAVVDDFGNLVVVPE